MIHAVRTKKGTKAITSDRWHVVHSRFQGTNGRLLFVRTVHSEHADRRACLAAARLLWGRLNGEGAAPAAERDEVFVRRPNFKSLERSRHRRRRLG